MRHVIADIDEARRRQINDPVDLEALEFEQPTRGRILLEAVEREVDVRRKLVRPRRCADRCLCRHRR